MAADHDYLAKSLPASQFSLSFSNSLMLFCLCHHWHPYVFPGIHNSSERKSNDHVAFVRLLGPGFPQQLMSNPYGHPGSGMALLNRKGNIRHPPPGSQFWTWIHLRAWAQSLRSQRYCHLGPPPPARPFPLSPRKWMPHRAYVERTKEGGIYPKSR